MLIRHLTINVKHAIEYTNLECKKQVTESPSQVEYPSLPRDLIRILCEAF